jgi:hypothetical protein
MIEKMAFLCLPAIVLVVLGAAFLLSHAFPSSVEDPVTRRPARRHAAA